MNVKVTTIIHHLQPSRSQWYSASC